MTYGQHARPFLLPPGLYGSTGRGSRGPVNSEVVLALAVTWFALRTRTEAAFVVPC